VKRPARGHILLEQPNRPTWTEIDLGAVAHNVARVVEMVGSQVDVLAVVKANAYGHGDIEVASAALGSGATWLGIACMSEAVSLRDAGIKDNRLLAAGRRGAVQGGPGFG